MGLPAQLSHDRFTFRMGDYCVKLQYSWRCYHSIVGLTASYIHILKWTLKFPGIDHNFLKLKKAVVCVFRRPRKFTICTTTLWIMKVIFYNIFTYIISTFLEFPGIISFLKNYPKHYNSFSAKNAPHFLWRNTHRIMHLCTRTVQSRFSGLFIFPSFADILTVTVSNKILL